MEEHEKNNLKLELLEASHFREVVWLYYTTCVELILRQQLFVDAEPNEGFEAGDYVVDKKSFQQSLFNLPNMPAHVKFILSSMMFNALNEMSVVHFCHLLELDREGEEAPMSIDHVLAQLSLPENKTKIEKLHGNAKANLCSLKAESERLWKQHGKRARKAFRNSIVHGHVCIYDQSSETFKAFAEKDNSIAFYKAMDGIFDILCRVSALCFGEEKLPDKKGYWDAFWNGNPNSLVWCFDTVKYPVKKLEPIDPQDRTLSSEDLK